MVLLNKSSCEICDIGPYPQPFLKPFLKSDILICLGAAQEADT